jgi:glycosyltransferase involved in cell wall biosynthesis
MLTLVSGAMGGSETYARALTRELATSTTIDAHAFVPRKARGFSEGVPEVVIDEIDGGSSTRDRLATVATATARGGRIRHRMGRVDVMHVPFTVAVPRPPAGVPLVQTLLDVQHLELPQMFTRAELAYRSWFYDRTATRADAVITISEAAKRQIVAHLGVDPERVHVAHLGVDTDRFTPQTGPRDDVVFYPARGWPHKNHLRLVEAVALLRETRPGLRLVLTGGGLETFGLLPDWVDVRGLVPPEELVGLYATAGCLAFPSLFEGFGLPPLEAMASGCPVAASDAGSIPEVCGDAAILFDPLDVNAMSAAIDRALDAPPALVASGLDRVREFTWTACARVHEDVYLDVAAARVPPSRP